MADVTFKNNFGTPISINSHRSKERTSLSVSGTLLFIGNTGIHGGACSLYHVSINKIILVALNMTFVDNFAIYGGALYMQDSLFDEDTPFDYVVNFANSVNFWNNSTMTAGNNIL